MPSRANLVHQTSVSTGPGAFAITAVNGRNNFAAAYGIGGSAVFWYFITNRQTPEWEVGVGHISAAGILERDAVIQNYLGNFALVNFSVGTKDVTSDIPAQEIDNVYGIQGITFKPGSDIDTDLISVQVGGSPRLRWNEAQDRFEWSHGIIVSSVAGGAAPGSILRLISTVGAGTTDAIEFGVGAGGALTAGRFDHDGVFHVLTGFMEFGALGDTSLARIGPGDLAVEGNVIYRAGGTDIPTGDIADLAITTPKIDNLAVVTAKIADGNVTYAKIQNGGGASVIGRASGAAGVNADISAGADGHVLRRNTTFLEFNFIDSVNIAANAIITTKIADDNVTNAKLANMAAQSIKMRNTGSTGDPQDQIHSDLTTAVPVSGDFALGWTAAGLLRKYDVVNFGGGGSAMGRRTISGADTVGTGDKGDIIEITSGTFSLAFTAAATLGADFSVYIFNNGTGDVTLDPNGAETIDGVASWVLYPGGAVVVHCNGTLFESMLLAPMRKQFDSNGTFTKPGVGTHCRVYCVGGGGSGGKASAALAGGGGGGGAGVLRDLLLSALGATETVTVGAGGAAQTVANTAGNAGASTTFGSLVTAFGGGGGGLVSGNFSGGGGGGGWQGVGANGSTSDQTGGLGGLPRGPATLPFGDKGAAALPGNPNSAGGGGGGGGDDGVSPAGAGGHSHWGGGGGGGSGSSNDGGAGGSSIYGGGGGGGGTSATPAGTGGASLNGGAGAAGAFDANNGAAGTQPGGGGGGSETGNSGAGGAGRCIVWVW